MSQRTNSNSRRQHSREPNDDRQPVPPPRLPSLLALAGTRERDSTFSRRVWTTPASRRAERIRNLDPPSSNLSEFRELHQLLDNTWGVGTSSSTSAAHPRSRNRMDFQGLEGDSDRLERSLDEANSHLRALLESTNHASLNISNLSSTLALPRNSPPPHRPSDLSEDSRRSKRRKLDSERSRPKGLSFRYGKYGQVEPGQLKMEMVSCDGGMFSNEFAYAAENILKNDSSVYCTKGNRCNIVLRHQAETIFTLKELVIKGPTSMNYSHPIREGMVFVAMNSDELLQRTAQYQIQYAAIPRNNSRPEDDNEPPRRRFALRRNDGTDHRRPRVYRGDDDDYRIAQMPPEFSTSQPNVGVSTECSDEDDGEGDSTRRSRRAPNRIGSLPFEDMYSEDEDEEEEANYYAPHEDDSYDWPGRSVRDPGAEPPYDAWNMFGSPHQSQSSSEEGDLLAPHARFFIEKKKSTCTIRFDPPVSGRFILLKMWNSHHDPTCNIDIQSVMTKGYAGPRFFPSIEMR